MTRRRLALPARYPLGSWPMQMRADMVAAYLDYRDTVELLKAITRGDAPRPSALRGKGRNREPVWNKDDLDRHVAPVATARQDSDCTKEDLRLLV